MKRILVTGFMRCGTTFVANLINSQKQCMIYQDFMHTLFRSSTALGIDSFLVALNDRQKNVLLSELKAESWAFGSNVMDSLTLDFSTLRQLYYNALELMQRASKSEVVGTKVTCTHHWHSRLINETDISIIYVYRDPRDVMLSSKNRFTWYNLSKFIVDYSRDLESAFRIDSRRFLRLRFEDLITDTDRQIASLSDFLGAQITTEIEALSDKGFEWSNNSSFHDITTLFDKGACYRWKTQIQSKEVRYCDIAMSSMISRLGYQPGQSYNVVNRLLVHKSLSLRKVRRYAGRLVSRLN